MQIDGSEGSFNRVSHIETDLTREDVLLVLESTSILNLPRLTAFKYFSNYPPIHSLNGQPCQLFVAQVNSYHGYNSRKAVKRGKFTMDVVTP